MKIEAKLFLFGAMFYFAITAIYGFWSRDEAGITALLFTGVMATLVAVYAMYMAKRVGTRPEDDPSADVEDAYPDYGFYSPHSWWPMVIALSAGVVVIGFVFAAWMVILGVIALMYGVFGLVFEYYRGYHAH